MYSRLHWQPDILRYVWKEDLGTGLNPNIPEVIFVIQIDP